MPFWNKIADLIIIRPKSDMILKMVEVKTTVDDKWCPDKREKEQFRLIKQFSEEHSIPAYYYIKENKKWIVENLKQVEKRIW